jgi:hypothetical protein
LFRARLRNVRPTAIAKSYQNFGPSMRAAVFDIELVLALRIDSLLAA